ncbi:MAG: exopolysaccharide biosynthesis polyprenyl glycosylphosphotransferase [Candidatus Andeanibacterium colombiense]|uniref:Exopolysaccharide biosynthesis polyprenyl glycosylphosphotransferase n=1 Tax=Candidatus Andeanibacterium colombiense TaxID=3121345 RepID=A0AAJ5X5S5_9SPHN|nr:MAG: exopolysaccharide biosynthesis polyprenyl glycosylphosphotransferase [Sphingomonadaceae bacterium]
MDGTDIATHIRPAELTPAYYSVSEAAVEAVSFPSLDARLAELRSVKFKRHALGLALLGSDVFAGLLAVVLSQFSYDGTVDFGLALAVVAACFPVYFLASLQTGSHNPVVARRITDSVRSSGMAFLVTAAIFFGALFATKIGPEVSRLQVGEAMLFCLVFGIAGRVAIARRTRDTFGAQPFADLCIYDDVPFSAGRGKGAIRASDIGLDPNLGRPDMVSRLGDLARGMDRVVVHCPRTKREAWSRALKCLDVRSEIVMPELTDLMPLDVRYRNGEVSMVLANGPLRWNQQWAKAIFDYCVALVAVILASPLMLLLALAVKLESKGPALFKQERIGLGNRRFQIWKFRTMRVEQTDHTGAVSARRDDDRVTKVGRFLRRTSLDELPQFFNVLAGQMSIIGPRPHAVGSRAEELLFWDIDQRYWHRHSVKPGITGLAQIRGFRGATVKRNDLEQRLYADLEYAANWSLLSDIRILMQTFGVLLHRNAY